MSPRQVWPEDKEIGPLVFISMIKASYNTLLPNTWNVDCWYNSDIDIADNHFSELLFRVIKLSSSFTIFSLKVIARIFFVSLRAFE